MSIKNEAIRHQEKALDHEASVWVAASAGSGKTRVLTNRVLKLLLKGAHPSKILCLTYTKAAAAEMRNRLNETLRSWVVKDEEALRAEIGDASILTARSLFARVLETPGGMRIDTIHSFAQGLLKRFPLEAGITPHFEVMDQEESNAALKEAQDKTLIEYPEEVSFIASRASEGRFRLIIAKLCANQGNLARLQEFYGQDDAKAQAAIADYLEVKEGQNQDDLFAEFIAGQDIEALKQATQMMLESKAKTDKEKGQKIANWLASEIKDIAEYQTAFLTEKGEARKELATKTFVKENPWAEEILGQELLRLFNYLEKSKAQEIYQASFALWKVGAGIIRHYQKIKEQKARLDYNDLINLALKLLRDPGAAWVLYKLDGGIDHLLIDEAQDTSPAQWEIARILADEFYTGQSAREVTRTLFVVGDVKQSIYGFQGAEPAKYAQMQEEFRTKALNSGQKWQDAPLYYSFRSVKAVLDVVDEVFSNTQAQEGIALEEKYNHHIATRENDGGLVEIWPLVKPKQLDEPEAWKLAVELIRAENAAKCLAKTVALKIKSMLGKEELLGKGRLINEGDILILLRKRGDLAQLLTQELKDQGINVAGSDRMFLAKELAVMDLLALAEFTLQPLDDLNLAALLKSPLIGFSEDDLFNLAHSRKGYLWAELGQRPEFAQIYKMLGELLNKADVLSPFDFFSHVLGKMSGKSRMQAAMGTNCLDAIDEFLNLCRKYVQQNPPSLQGFVQWFKNSQAEIKRDMEQNVKAVRIMTVHGAKGLQAPIVFLPDSVLSKKPGGDSGPLLFWPKEKPALIWVPGAGDRISKTLKLEEEIARTEWTEYWRLLYVAMTRAEDRLYVCGYRGKREGREESWYNLIQASLEKLGEKLEDGSFRLVCEQKIKPSLPLILRLEEFIPELPLWLSLSAPSEPVPPRPLAPSKEIEPDIKSALGSEYARKRGILAHKLLQYLPEYPIDRWQEKGEAFLARMASDWNKDARQDLIQKIINLLQVPEIQHIFGSNSRAEVPITGIWNNRIVSGRVDRLVITDKEILIIDYKTGNPVSSLATIPAQYIQQMEAYAGVLSQIWPELLPRPFLLWLDGPKIFEIKSKILGRTH